MYTYGPHKLWANATGCRYASGMTRRWVNQFPNPVALGQAAALDIAVELGRILATQATARVVFAAAPSQQETLKALLNAPDIAWDRVTVFHMDEYMGLPHEAPERFGAWLREAFFDKLPLRAVHLLDPDVPDAARSYAIALAEAPIDIVCMGIGVNGHIAFNDPPVADFADPLDVKEVVLDESCRQQQVDDGCFASLADVPTRALSLTVPRLLNASTLFCMVPGAAKARAVEATLFHPLSTEWPSTILRTHPNCTLYVDASSGARVGIDLASPHFTL